ncbi:MAG: ATP-binding cassette domain-containing protein, partial [Candidatus Binatia bacterium]|nr:ATP-binding cassette domain-containing protein [Candidatus Binatia bacterium]
KAFAPEDIHEAADLLEQLGLRHKADEKVHSLSGGEQQRVAIARAFMQHPQLVLADEFVSHLDPVTTGDIMTLVRRAARAGVTFVITSHEVEVVAEYGEHAVFLRQGEKAYDGPARTVTLAAATRLMGAG